MRLKITTEDVQAADQIAADFHKHDGPVICNPATFCPAAQALGRLGYDQVHVGSSLAVVRRGEWRGRFLLPLALQAQIESWDHGFGFQPIEVELTQAN